MNRRPVVRFAPSPTGFMHLGNVRAALLNFLFARQKEGTFILRIEDTDPQRNVDVGAKHILDDLSWLNLTYDQGPIKGGPNAPYFQSERTNYYKTYLEKLKAKNMVYSCFCSPEELETKRQRQIALRQPPRYDRACLRLSPQERTAREASSGCIWRFMLPDETVSINDLGRGTVVFDFKHFSDFPLTRQDGSFTFIFANFVDDLLMGITHVIRGEDHLTNTALQAALYQAFDHELPSFWHLPIICNAQGKKLSKRDFGFSLSDLRMNGFLPEAICNYLAILGGSFEQEIMSFDELIKTLDFNHTSSASTIKYDTEKLRWMNHKWLSKISLDELATRCRPYLIHAYKNAEHISQEKLMFILSFVRTEMVTLHDCVNALAFYFKEPKIVSPINQTALSILKKILKSPEDLADSEAFIERLRKEGKTQNLSTKELFAALRQGLTGQMHGPSIKELIELLGAQESYERLNNIG